MASVTLAGTSSPPASAKTAVPPATAGVQPVARTVPPALTVPSASPREAKRQVAGTSAPVGRGVAPEGEPFTGSAYAIPEAAGGQAHAPALQTSDDAAQSVTGCQVRQAEPAVAGWHRSTDWPAALHDRAPSCVQASWVGQAQVATPPEATQVVAGSVHGAEEAGYRQPAPSWAQVTTSPPVPQKLDPEVPHGVVAQAQAAAPPAVEQAWWTGQSVATGPEEHTPEVGVQVRSRSPSQVVPGRHCPAVVWPGQERAAVLQAPSEPHPWSVGQFRSDEHGAPVVVTLQAERRAARANGRDLRIASGETTRIRRASPCGRRPPAAEGEPGPLRGDDVTARRRHPDDGPVTGWLDRLTLHSTYLLQRRDGAAAPSVPRTIRAVGA